MESRTVTVNDTVLDNRLLWTIFGALIILVFYPWIFFLTLLGFVLGFCSLDFVQHTVQPWILARLKKNIDQDLAYDPLLRPGDNSRSRVSCRICNSTSCSRDSHQSRLPRRMSHHLTLDLRIDSRLDTALARFFTAVFTVYVSPDWAPYDTRLELKRILVKTLLSFGNGVKETFFGNQDDSVIFVRQKVLPLFLFHVNGIRQGVTITQDEEEEAREKVLALTKILLTKYLNPGDTKCKLWNELVLSVLGSGVFWNLILLGRRELPGLLKDLYDEHKGSYQNQTQSISEGSSSHLSTPEEISLLFDSFLDPARDVEQPLAIASRYRPTMSYVLNESDLLYCLIQFLKGEGALEWLQILLEQEPGQGSSVFARKVIEIKHLNHFARSRIFLENVGFSRVESAQEVDPDLYHPSANLKASAHHARSSSYGGGAGSSGGIFDKNVVEGVAIYPALMSTPVRSSLGSSSSSMSPPTTEHDSLFRRRDALEPFIAKFFASLHHSPEADSFEEPTYVLNKRVGTEPKARKRPVLKRIVISESPTTILETLTSTVISLLRKDSPWKAVFAGWINLLHPMFNEKLTQVLDDFTRKALGVENIVVLINLVTDVFIESEDPAAKEKKEKEKGEELPKKIGTGNVSHVEAILETMFDIEELLNTLSQYPDGILLFFVDLLDLLVSTLTTPPHSH